DYRSIHTTVIGPGRQRVELQIRTREMHEIAEYGIAAHALYKDGHGTPTEMLSRESNAYAWLRHTIELLSEGVNSEEFLEHTKLELFHDQVFCFTPKGRLIPLPRKATAIDFAYAVHTDEELQGALARLARHWIDEVMAAVGRGEMRASDVARAMYPDYKEERVARAATPKPESGWFGLSKVKSLIFKVPDGKDAGEAI